MNNWASRIAVSGVSSDGLCMTALPAARAGPTLCRAKFKGKLNGSDRSNNAQGFPDCHCHPAFACGRSIDRDSFACQFAGSDGGSDKCLLTSFGFYAGLLDGLARLQREQLGQLASLACRRAAMRNRRSDRRNCSERP